ncbi:MAG: energy transducer TonB [Tannerellaceae bacterium]|nr:energy transducer TonB [Tannerellaceae bacterium]
MKLLEYIKGNRRGKDARRLEQEALTEPFLSDALDGYIQYKGDAFKDIQQLQNRVKSRAGSHKQRIQLWSAAAVILLFLAAGSYFLMNPVDESDIYFSLAHDQLLLDEDIYPYSQSAYSTSHQLVAESEPVPLFAFPVPIGGEVYVAPYLSIIKGEFNYTQLQPELLKEGVGRKPQPLIEKGMFKEYLSNSIQIPIEGACAAIKGKVTLSFRVNPTGRPYDIQVIKGLCSTLDQEAVRLVREGPDWKFGDQEVKMTIQL